jgi:2-polyprenylphenol 6-hydroxylase
MTQQLKTQIDADVVIVGAGLVGLSAAISFAKQDKKVVIVDTKNTTTKLKKTWDARVYALTPATEKWLQTLGVWADVDQKRVNNIDAMHLFTTNVDAPLQLKAEDANCAKLGLIIENQNLMHALLQQVNAAGVTVITDLACTKIENTTANITLHLEDKSAITAKLLLAADGVSSWVRERANISVAHKSFEQTAVVANFKIEKPHHNVARQCFAPHDVLALLPLPQQMVSIVWSVSTQKAAELLMLSADELAQSVLEHSQGLLGELSLIGKPQQFALNQSTAKRLIGERMVLLGDAAHQIHPMAGQGVNLGFRDVMQLQQLTTNTHNMMDIGDSALLRQYERARLADIASMNTLTSGLDALFASENNWLNTLRDFGFKQLSKQVSIKKLLIQQATA